MNNASCYEQTELYYWHREALNINAELTKSKFLAGLVPLILFTLVHLTWGVGHLVFVFVAGGLFTIVYAAKRNLALIIIAHFIVDIIALLVLPVLLGT